MLAVSGTVLIGMVALAAEAGLWQMQKRETRNAADLGALAGATVIERNGDAVGTATDATARNGFATGTVNGKATTVTVNRPPATGAYAGNNMAVEVIVSQTQNLGMARVVLNTPPVVTSRAVAASSIDTRVCMLALGGGITLGGNSTVRAERCAIASNAVAPNGITVAGNARVRVDDLVTVGNCNRCSTGDVYINDNVPLTRPRITAGRMTPITDPFESLQSWTPSPSGACQTVAYSNRIANIAPGRFCGDILVGPNQTLNLEPGLYYLDDASLTVQGRITGNGVTIVLTNTSNLSDVGTVLITAQANVTLSGPATALIPPEGPANGPAAGLVFYRDGRATNNTDNDRARFNGGATMSIAGGIYMPTTPVVVNGNYGSSAATCMPVVAYSLNYSGASDSTIDVSGCPGNGVPVIRVARLVE